MGYTVAAENAAIGAVATAATYISLHTADPGTTGANEVTGGTYARVATTWGTVSNGSYTGSQVTINVPSGTTIGFWGIWSVATGGTTSNFFYGGSLPASESFGSAGTYALTPTITASN